MPYTAQKPVNPGKLIALSLTETLFVLSWGLLGGALLLPFTSHWYAGCAPAGLLAAWMLAGLEIRGVTGPLQAFEMREYTSGGRRNTSRPRTFLRILLTAALFPPLMFSCLPLLFRQRSIPELLTGSKLTSMDRRLDPRPHRMIEARRKGALSRSRILILVPLAASAAVFVLRHSVPEAVNLPITGQEASLPEHERELLAQYLELTTLHPEELEYHVRLASLYYRNGMREDLQNQLDVIAAIDPDHAIMILADSGEIAFEELLVVDTVQVEETIPILPQPVETDSLEEDSLSTDTLSADTLDTELPDTLAVQEDSTAVPEPDSLPELETVAADTTTFTPEAADTLPEPTEQEEEVAVEPDTLVQP